MNNQTAAKTSLFPAWLWFWLGVYIVSLPKLINYLIYLFQDSINQYYTWSTEVGGENSFFELLRVINFYEIAAYVIVLVGIISIFFPKVRGKIVENKYKLVKKDENPAIQEITAFVRQYVPQIQVKANVLRTDLFAITYPLGFRKPALGIFGKTVKLWRSDRKSAEAILLHEISHIRQGDTLVLGAGSLFETAISYWVWIFLLLVFIPIVFYTGGTIISLPSQTILFLSNGFLSCISELLTTFGVFLLPLAGVWVSELLADRLATEELKSNETMLNAMDLLSEEKDWQWKEKIRAGATHPPTSLRRYFVKHTQSWQVTLLLVVSFPLTYFVRLLVNLGTLLPSLLTGVDDFFHQANLVFNVWAESALPIFIAMTLWLLLWNRLEPWWGKIFNSSENSSCHAKSKLLVFSAIVPLVAALCAGILLQITASPDKNETVQSATLSAQTTIPAVLDNHYKIGQVFQAGDAQVIVMGWENLTDSPELQGVKDKKIIQVEVAVRNNGKDTIPPLVSCARLKDASGKEYHFSLEDSDNSIIYNHDLPSDAPRPGQNIRGKISFLVDQKSDEFQFIYLANPPLDMTRSYVELTDDPAGQISPPETLPESSNLSDASLNQALGLKDFSITVTKVWTINSKVITPDPGNKLIALDLTINNTGSQPFKISNIFLLELEDEDGITYSPKATATGAIGKKLPQEDLTPGKQVSLSLGFVLPEKQKKMRLQYVPDNKKTIELRIP
jgi:Zn-dependent protease with chaperone function